MSTTTLELAITASKLEPENALAVRTEFHPFFVQASEWVEKVKTVTDPKVARESRLALKGIRCDAENVRKRLKSEVIAYGNAIDGCYKVIAGVTEPLEATLIGIEQAAELAEKARRNDLRRVRGEALKPYLPAVELSGLDEMTEPDFQKLLESVKTAREAQIEKDKQIETARVIQAEKDRVYAENLKRVQDEENARVKAERDAAIKKAADEKAISDAREATERLAREKLEKEKQAALAEAERLRKEATARARQEADRVFAEKKKEENRILAEQLAAEKAAQAPDREKLLGLARWLENVPDPGVKSKAGQVAAEEICDRIGDLITFIETAAAKL